MRRSRQPIVYAVMTLQTAIHARTVTNVPRGTIQKIIQFVIVIKQTVNGVSLECHESGENASSRENEVREVVLKKLESLSLDFPGSQNLIGN